MLDKQTKREVIEAVLNEEIGGMMFKYEQIKEVQQLEDAVIVMKSAFGFVANQTYDALVDLAEDYNEFVQLVFTEVEDEYFRLMMLLLYNTINIEHVLNQYILDLFDRHN